MKLLAAATLLALVLVGCGGGTKSETSSSASSSAAESSAASETSSASATATGCTASGLDAMTALSDFELQMGDAQKAGKITVDQLTAARDKLFTETQAAADQKDWAAYCKAIDDMRAELGL
ncbi:hypothetical protein [Mycobacterium sp. M26]|uniref:hypothetical protein n=1 Tax=Mycobacterium sp. M26 TaxID=1762962 RepID=UPI00073F2FAE|nr:hypothetical protein [Mycobacterium sp. M26]